MKRGGDNEVNSFVPVKDYIKSRKKLYVKFIFPMVVATTALAITLFFNFGDGEKLNAVFSEFISTQINTPMVTSS